MADTGVHRGSRLYRGETFLRCIDHSYGNPKPYIGPLNLSQSRVGMEKAPSIVTSSGLKQRLVFVEFLCRVLGDGSLSWSWGLVGSIAHILSDFASVSRRRMLEGVLKAGRLLGWFRV